MVGLLLYASGVGVFASRKSARACERTLAFIAIVGEDRPDFRTLRDVRTLPLAAVCDVCVQGLRIAGESGLVKLGNVSTDGTQLQGHASRPKARSYGDRTKAVERVRAEMEAVVTQAYPQDAEDDAALGSRRGDAWPAAWARREDRLSPSEAALQRLEARATAAAEAERQRRAEAAAARKRLGNKRRGSPPKAVDEPPEDTAQMRCTEPELGIRQTKNQGWEECGNAPASVEGAYQLLVACDVTAEANDKQHAVPMAQLTAASWEQAAIERPQDAAGGREKIPGPSDSGYYSAAAAEAVEQWGCDPSMATGRQRHPAPEAEVSTAPTTAKERMAAQVRTPEGRARYARRQGSVAPVCGQSKEARGVRRFLRRGLDTIRGEGRLVCLPHNRLKMWRYTCAPMTV